MKNCCKPWHGLLMFGAFLAFQLTAGTYMQSKLGIAGLVLDEICIFLLAVGTAILQKTELKTVFPLTPPPFNRFFGCALQYGGIYFGVQSISMLMVLLFPDAMQTSDSISKLITSMPAALAILVIAVLPAICEETLFRGYLLSSMKPLRRKWLIILIVGILFGAAHLDPYRFLQTAILGGFLTYLTLETGSVFYAVFFHFINNLISVVQVYLSAGTDTTDAFASLPPASVVGSALFYLGISAFLLYFGTLLFRKQKQSVIRFFIVSGLSMLPIAAGMALAAIGAGLSVMSAVGSALYCLAAGAVIIFIVSVIMTRKKPKTALLVLFCVTVVLCAGTGWTMTLFGQTPPLYASSVQLDSKMTEKTETVTVEQGGEYELMLNALASEGTLELQLSDGSETYASFEGSSLIGQTRTLTLSPGVYTVTYRIQPADGAERDKVYGQLVCTLSLIRVEAPNVTDTLPEL